MEGVASFVRGGANVVIDGQWGSTGKGKLAAFLAHSCPVDYATADFQSNAGHTVVLGNDTFVVHHIPAGFVNLDATLYLAPAATITVDMLLQEIEALEKFRVADRLKIHPHVAVIRDEDVKHEKQALQGIASTMKGVGSALARKVQRNAVLAKDEPKLQPFIADLTHDLCIAARMGAPILVETAQGFDLSLNHGTTYPFVTSRDVTVGSALSNVGLPASVLANVWGSLRTFPIRVGNLIVDGVEVGHSGPHYPDQVEMTWQEISNRRPNKPPVQEITTVTKRVRRVFTWSNTQFSRFMLVNRPTHLFLNFVNYLDARLENCDYRLRLTVSDFPAVDNFIRNCRRFLKWGAEGCDFRLLGTGPANDHMVIL